MSPADSKMEVLGGASNSPVSLLMKLSPLDATGRLEDLLFPCGRIVGLLVVAPVPSADSSEFASSLTRIVCARWSAREAFLVTRCV